MFLTVLPEESLAYTSFPLNIMFAPEILPPADEAVLPSALSESLFCFRTMTLFPCSLRTIFSSLSFAALAVASSSGSAIMKSSLARSASVFAISHSSRAFRSASFLASSISLAFLSSASSFLRLTVSRHA